MYDENLLLWWQACERSSGFTLIIRFISSFNIRMQEMKLMWRAKNCGQFLSVHFRLALEIQKTLFTPKKMIFTPINILQHSLKITVVWWACISQSTHCMGDESFFILLLGPVCSVLTKNLETWSNSHAMQVRVGYCVTTENNVWFMLNSLTNLSNALWVWVSCCLCSRHFDKRLQDSLSQIHPTPSTDVACIFYE